MSWYQIILSLGSQSLTNLALSCSLLILTWTCLRWLQLWFNSINFNLLRSATLLFQAPSLFHTLSLRDILPFVPPSYYWNFWLYPYGYHFESVLWLLFSHEWYWLQFTITRSSWSSWLAWLLLLSGWFFSSQFHLSCIIIFIALLADLDCGVTLYSPTLQCSCDSYYHL